MRLIDCALLSAHTQTRCAAKYHDCLRVFLLGLLSFRNVSSGALLISEHLECCSVSYQLIAALPLVIIANAPFCSTVVYSETHSIGKQGKYMY